MVPPLCHLSGSWIIIDRTSGRAVMETFSESTAARVNTARYEVLTSYAYLSGLNR